MKKEIILITPPFVQLNSPYPAASFLSAYLQENGYQTEKVDLSIQTARAIFNRKGLTDIFDLAVNLNAPAANIAEIIAKRDYYLNSIDQVMDFLSGKLPVLAYKIAGRRFLPEGSRFSHLKEQKFKIESLEISDGARYLASLYLDDLADLVTSVVPDFGFSRYAEKISQSQHSFDRIYAAVQAVDDYVMQRMKTLLAEIDFSRALLIGITVPFPGNLLSALKICQWLKSEYPQLPVCLGGGFVNTELRQISDIRLFEFIDYLTFDDGEEPLLVLADNHSGKAGRELVRTAYLENRQIVFSGFEKRSALPTVTPDYRNIDFTRYFSLYENPNPMFRLWSEKGFLKLRLAHGCYWHRCAFCDTELDYIATYQPLAVEVVVRQIETLIEQTGQNSFHFIDEALPPALITALAAELVRRDIKILWWGNIRFEQNFTSDVCRLLALSGCLAVSGGLEAANERILKVMNKGITPGTAASVCRNFKKQGILVHGYLIYGFPGQLDRETVESLEIVRQFFANKLIDSVYWHRFSLTAHSPVGKEPQKFGVTITSPQPAPFANNDLEYVENKSQQQPDKFAYGLNKAVYNYMYGSCIDYKLQKWFNFKLPEIKIENDYISREIQREQARVRNWNLVWLGGVPELEKSDVRKEKILRVKGLFGTIEYSLPGGLADWLSNMLTAACSGSNNLRRDDLEKKFPLGCGLTFSELLRNELWQDFLSAGLFMLD